MSIQIKVNVRTLRCRELQIQLGQRTLIMGILNTTPDSFSDGGSAVTVAAAVEKAEALVAAGADIIDIGGESTRPGATPVTAEEELARVIPVIEQLRKRDLGVPISIDTYKAKVAEQALQAGAHIINDVWGLLRDPQLADLAARYDCPLILTHNRKQMRPYRHVMKEVIADLEQSIAIARAAGVRDDQIILDPGICFAKSLDDNLQAMRQLHDLVTFGYPVLLGTSRKSMIQKTLGLPAQEVLEGTAATVVLGIAQGCHIVRVHDVAEMKKAVQMADAIVRQEG